MPKPANNSLTFKQASELFRYDPETGKLYARTDSHKGRWRAGREAGYKIGTGYLAVCVGGGEDRKFFKVHRLAWLLHYGSWPEDEVDHINGVRTDNRIANLRAATSSQNLSNRGPARDGLKGAYPAYGGRWRSSIGKGSKFQHLGHFDTEQEAHEAFCKAAAERYGEFARFD